MNSEVLTKSDAALSPDDLRRSLLASVALTVSDVRCPLSDVRRSMYLV